MTIYNERDRATVELTGRRLVVDVTDGIGSVSLDGVELAPSATSIGIDMSVAGPVTVTLTTIGPPVDRIKAALANEPG